MTKADHEPISFAEAQRRLGMDGPRGQKLQRHVERKERETGRVIATRKQRDSYVTSRVTMAALRIHCPELFPGQVDTMEKTVRGYLAQIDERISEVVSEEISRHVDPKLDELWQRDEIIAKNVTELTKRVAKVTEIVHRKGT